MTRKLDREGHQIRDGKRMRNLYRKDPMGYASYRSFLRMWASKGGEDMPNDGSYTACANRILGL